jgi:enoyl-CoA hydratase
VAAVAWAAGGNALLRAVHLARVTDEYEQIEYEERDRVARIRLDRPATLNALTPTTLAELEAAIERAETTDDLRAITLAGTGRAFSAGYDVGPDEEIPPLAERMANPRTHLRAVVDSRLPVVAAVDGPALAGGCNLAIAADITLATPDATFGYPDMRFGEPPPKFVLPFATNSLKHARELLFTGKTVDANRAAEMGLVNRVVDDLEAAVESELDGIRTVPPAALSLVKDMLTDVQEAQGFRRAGRVEEYAQLLTMETEPARRFREIRDEEGLQAALEWANEVEK